MSNLKLSDMEKDALAEMASIACGNASATLSNLIGGRVIDFMNPTADMPILKDIPKIVGGSKKLVVGTYAPVSDDLSGNMVVVFLRENAFLLVDLSENKKRGTTQVIDEKGRKLINEVGLAIISAYTNALDILFELKTSHGDPRFFSTFGESITDFISLGIEEAERTFLSSFKISFSIAFKVKGDFVFLSALAPVDCLLEAVRSKLEPKQASKQASKQAMYPSWYGVCSCVVSKQNPRHVLVAWGLFRWIIRQREDCGRNQGAC